MVGTSGSNTPPGAIPANGLQQYQNHMSMSSYDPNRIVIGKDGHSYTMDGRKAWQSTNPADQKDWPDFIKPLPGNGPNLWTGIRQGISELSNAGGPIPDPTNPVSIGISVIDTGITAIEKGVDWLKNRVQGG